MTIKFDVTNRWSGKVQFTAEIDCDESASTSIKLGLARCTVIAEKPLDLAALGLVKKEQVAA